MTKCVAELMNTQKLFPFLNAGDAAIDIDSNVTSGMYRVSGTNYINGPQATLYGVLCVFRGGKYISQIILGYIGASTAYIWVRSGVVDDKFGQWVKFVVNDI